eukprot:761909-Hanusia_phi.AAC.1
MRIRSSDWVGVIQEDNIRHGGDGGGGTGKGWCQGDDILLYSAASNCFIWRNLLPSLSSDRNKMSQQSILNYYNSNKGSKPREFDELEGLKGGKRKSSQYNHEDEEVVDYQVSKKQNSLVMDSQNFPLAPILRTVGLRTKTFHDRIYGQVTNEVLGSFSDKCLQIELDPLIIRIMDTKQFQRLQQLKQLGLCENVFRAANHTSVGAMHLATRMMQTLEEQRRKDKKLRKMYP